MEIILVLLILIYSAVIHEIAHGYIAYRMGDPTAKLLGRLTLNPVSHLDPIYSFLIPIGLFLSGLPVIGGAKPVPIDSFNLKDGKKDLAIISIAGPLTNLLLAVLASIIVHILFPNISFYQLHDINFIGLVLYLIIWINLSLGIFNLVPLPPLDGSKLFAMLLSDKLAETYLAIGNSGFGLFIIIALFYFPLGGFSFSAILSTLISSLLKLLGF